MMIIMHWNLQFPFVLLLCNIHPYHNSSLPISIFAYNFYSSPGTIVSRLGCWGGLWSYSVLSLNPRNADCRLIADESYLLSIFLFLFSFILHITVLRLLFTGRVPIALRCWDYPVFIFIFILFLCATTCKECNMPAN